MSKPLHPRLYLFVLAVLSLFVLTGFGCRRTGTPTENIGQSLVMWGLWQESADMKLVLKTFKEQTGIEVEYKKIASVATYEKMLLEALAQGRGPDVFVIHHTWVNGKRGLLAAAPATVVDERAVREEFVEVVAQDLVRDGSVYALPTSVDTLAMYYNKELLSSAGIARPPATWQDLQTAVQRMTKITRLGSIEQSAGALGTAANINRAPDILQLLMLQSGLSIIDPASGKSNIVTDIGQRALTFYTDFSNKSKEVYTWDLQQDFSIDAFAEGDTAMMFNYSYHLPTIRAKNPRLDLAIAPIPQIADSRPISLANYWPFAVSTTSQAPGAAWQFLRFLTSQPAAQIVNEAQGAPPARRDSIEEVARDPILGVFAEQTLTAATWPRYDIVATDAIFNSMIDDVVTGAAAIPDVLRRVEDQLDQLSQNQ